MKKKPKILAVILARIGSKGVKKKNIKDLCGHPLISYSIYAAKKSKLISKVIVSTDSLKIKKISQNYGAEVPFLRPKKLALDHIWSRDALKHAVLEAEKIYKEKYDFIVELPAVAPFRNREHIDNAIIKLIKKKSDSVIAMTRVYDKHPIRIKKINSGKILDFNKLLIEGESSRRQDLTPAFVRNGSIYAMKRNLIIKNFSRKGKKSLSYLMSEMDSINIDQISDFHLAESLVLKGYCKNKPATIFVDKNIDYSKRKNKNLLITYKQKIAGKIFNNFNYKNIGIIYCSPKNLDNLKYKDSIIAWLVSTDIDYKINNRITKKFLNLKFICSPTTGLTHIDKENINNKIKILNLNTLSKTKFITASSEFTVSLILQMIRNTNIINNVVLSSNWRNKEDILRGNELSNFKFGIFGFGRIGKNIAKFLKIFNCKVFFYDPYVKSTIAKKIKNLKLFLNNTNFLIISSKLTKETENFFDSKKLKYLQKGSYLINISRGEMLVEKDLIKLISKKHISKVGLDVLKDEHNVLKSENALIKMSRSNKNIIISPHIAGLTYNSEFKALKEIKKLIIKNF